MKTLPVLSFLALLLVLTAPCLADRLDTKTLIEIAARHQVPMPPPNARLVLAHTQSWTVLGNRSTSRDPAIYAPAFLLRETDRSIDVLMGMEQRTIGRIRAEEPLWRPFSTNKGELKPGG